MLVKKTQKLKLGLFYRLVLNRTTNPNKNELENIIKQIGKVDKTLCEMFEKIPTDKKKFLTGNREGDGILSCKKPNGLDYIIIIKSGKITKVTITNIW